MFKLYTGITSPTLSVDDYTSTGIFQFGQTPNTGIIGITLLPPTLDEPVVPITIIYPDPVTSGSNITIDAPLDLNYLIGVTVNGQLYSGSPYPGVPDTCYYDLTTNTITIYNILFSSNSSLTIQLYTTFISYEKTTEVTNIPSVIEQYGLTGTVSISRQFEQHPSADMELLTDSSQIASVRTTFKQNKLIDIYSIGFRVSSYSEVIETNNQYPHGYYRVSVSLEGKYAMPLEETIFLKMDTPFSATSLISCNSTSPNTFLGSPTAVTLNTLATRTGVNYSGYNFNVIVPKDTANDATTTFISELSSRVRIPEHFIFYSDRTSLTTKNFRNTPTWILGSGDIIGAISVSKRVRALAYKAVELQVSPVISPFSSSTPLPPQNVISVIVEDPENAAQPPTGYTSVKTTDINFDASGTVKIRKETTYENGTIIKEVVQKYGFAFLSIDAFNISSNGQQITFQPANATIFWKKVEDITTTYTYHSITGYLLKITSTGWKLGRFETEPNPSPVWEYTQEPGDAPLVDLYRFITIPYYSQTEYELRQFRDYYTDVPSFPSGIQILCDLNGNPVAVPVLDPNYVEPMFVAKSQTFTSCFAHTQIPNELVDYLGNSGIKTTGEETKVTTTIQIKASSNTVAYPPLGLTFNGSPLSDIFVGSVPNGTKVEDSYTEFIHNYSAQDPGFKSITEKIEQQTNQGKPPEATRKKYPDNTVVPTTELSNSKHILTTTGYSSYSPSNGSLSYPNATLEESFTAAKIDLKIRDTQENETYSFSTYYNPNIAEGDRAVFSYNGETYTGTVLSSNSALEIVGELVGYTTPKVNGITNLTIGKTSNIDTTVTLTTLPPITMATTPIPVAPGYTIYQGFSLGGITTPILQGRGNF